MEQFTAAAISTRNLIGEPDTAIRDMEKWLIPAAEQGAELALFPELNVIGYIPHAIARDIAEPVPGPSTEKIICLAERYQMNIAFGLIEQDTEKLYCTYELSTVVESWVNRGRSTCRLRNSRRSLQIDLFQFRVRSGQGFIGSAGFAVPSGE